MLWKKGQYKHLKHVEGRFFEFVDNGNVTDEERQRLLKFDASCYYIYGEHAITNLEELKGQKEQKQ